MKLIGITGRARSGKDTAAQYLAEELGLLQYALAEPIKRGVAAMFNLTHEHIYGSLKEEIIPHIGASPRYIMQTIGTDWGRNMIADNVWLRMAEHKFQDVQRRQYANGMVISDVRFENEASMVRRLGGVVLHISRAGAPEVNKHASEKGVVFQPLLGDVAVFNDDSIEDLHHTLRRIFVTGEF